MNNSVEKLKNILEKVDLTKTQVDRATELYTNLCKTIEEKMGLNINFYPQGSFATKTAVRPYRNGKDQAYDVDVICEVDIPKDSILPNNLKDVFKHALNESRYSTSMTEWDKCFTIEFKEKDGVEFSIDIIPSVPENMITKHELSSITEKSFLVETSIAIPNTKTNTWLTNNPKGYIKWFEEEIAKFHKNYIVDRNMDGIFASIEDLPDDDSSNMLLDVIKVLKRTRDVFYYRRSAEGKPASIIITTIVGKLASNLRPTSDVIDLFTQVIEQLQYLKEYPQKTLSQSTEITGYPISNIIKRDNGEWNMANPANGNDNILSSWNEDENRAKEFFKWVDYLYKTFVEKLVHEEEFRNLYDAIAIEKPEHMINKPQFAVNSSPTKPWRNL